MKNFLRNFAFFVLAATAYSQGLVTIQSNPPYTSASGVPLNGYASISWQPFTTAYGTVVPPGAINVNIAAGVFTRTVQLYPNVGANPPGTSYTVLYNFSGSPVYTRNWYVPASGVPVNVAAIEFPPAGLQQTNAIISPAQLLQAGAVVNQALCWNGAYWGPGSCGGGSSIILPGATGALLYNAGSNNFGATGLGSTTQVYHGNSTGVGSFGPVVNGDIANGTIDLTTKVTNVLPPVNGGTGTGTAFSQGSVLFSGTAGIFQQDPSNFFWNSAQHQLGIGTPTTNASITIQEPSGNSNAISATGSAGAGVNILLRDGNATRTWSLSATISGTLSVLDTTTSNIPLSISSLDDVLVCGATDGTFRFDVQCSQSGGTMRIWDQTSGGITTLAVRGGIAQGSTPLVSFTSNGGNTLSSIGSDGSFGAFSGGQRTAVVAASIVGLGSSSAIQFRNNVSWDGGTVDGGISRLSAGLLGIGNGTPGDSSASLQMTGLTLNGGAGSGTQCLQVNNSGVVGYSGAACAGGGTVTNTIGPLIAGRVMVGNAGNDSTVISSLGTSTTVLHGNAGGNPGWSAVVLTTDVSGILPFANGGLGTASNFANHLFYGNNTGSTAAPVATQPTFADLAAGTVGAVGTFPGGDFFAGGLDSQTGTSYTVLSSDENKLLSFNNASSVAVTLPSTGTSGFGAGAIFYMYNLGAGAVTVTPNTSTINGGSSIVLNQSQGAFVESNGTHYVAWISAAPTGSGTVTSLATTSPITGGTITTTGTIACATCVTSGASLTANQLVIGSGSQGSQALGSLGTTSQVLVGNASGAPAWTTLTSGLLPATVVYNNASNAYSTGTQNFSSAAHTIPTIVVASVGALPGTCTAGELAFVTGATAGQQIYECSATNTWTQQTGGGGGGSTGGGAGVPPYSTTTITSSPMTITGATHAQGKYAFGVCWDASTNPQIEMSCNWSRNPTNGDLIVTYTVAPAQIDIFGSTGGSGAFLSSAPYNFPAQAPGGSLTASSPSTVTLSPCPAGVNGTDALHYLYISGGTGTAEPVLITGGTCTALASSGTVVFTPANNHSGAWTVQSGSSGIKEALIACAAASGGGVVIPGGNFNVWALLDISNNCSLRGSGINVTLLEFQSVVTRGLQFIGSAGNGDEIYLSDLSVNYLSVGTSQESLYVQDVAVGDIHSLALYNAYDSMTLVSVAHLFVHDIYEAPQRNGINLSSNSGSSVTGASYPQVDNVHMVLQVSTGTGLALSNILAGPQFTNMYIEQGQYSVTAIDSTNNVNEVSLQGIFTASSSGAIFMNITSASFASRWIIHNSLIDSNGFGIEIFAGTSNHISDVTITGNTIGYKATTGIGLKNVRGARITGNTVYVFGSTTGVGNAIELVNGPNINVTISGNDIGGGGNATGTSANDVLLDAQAHAHVNVSSNTLYAAGTATISDSHTGAGPVEWYANGGVDDIVPSVSSASSLAFPVNPTFSLTGTTGVSSVSGLFIGERGMFTPGGAVTFTAGATIGNTFTTSSNVPVNFFFDGTKVWLH